MINPSLRNYRLRRELFFRLAALILATLVTVIVPSIASAQSETRIISLSGDLNFGDVVFGSSAGRFMTISNSGNSTLTVTNIEGFLQPVSLLGGYSADWSGTIAPGTSQDVIVTFDPGGISVLNNTNPVDYPGSLEVISDATSGTDSIQVSGTGVFPTRVIFLTGDLNFGDVAIGTSAQHILTIINRGNSILTVTNISIENPSSPGIISADYSGPVYPGAGVSVPVTFTPGNVAPSNPKGVHYSALLDVVSDATSGTNSVEASGAGVLPQYVTRIISVNTNLNFGPTPIGLLPLMNLVIANKGNSDLTISNINFPEGFSTFVFDAFGGYGGYGILASGSTNVTIPAGSRMNIPVTFAPTNVMRYGGTVTIDSDAISGKGQFTVSGQGEYPAGHYIGLFAPGMGPFFSFFSPAGSNAVFGDSGYFSANVTANGSFSGVLLLAGTRQPFSGRFSPSGAYSGMIGSPVSPQIIPGGGNIYLGVSFQLSGLSWQGVISNQEWSADLLAYSEDRVRLYNVLPPGKYHFDIAGSTDPLLAPTNDGTGTIQLTESGAAHVSGTLGDGTPFSQDTTLVLRRLPLYAPLYHGQGAVLGWITCDVVPTNIVEGFRPPMIEPGTNLFPLTNYPIRTNPVGIIITPFTNPAPATNIPAPLSSRIAPVPDELSRARSVTSSSLTLSGTNRITGSMNWFKPAQIDSNYPSGFSFQTTVHGPTQ